MPSDNEGGKSSNSAVLSNMPKAANLRNVDPVAQPGIEPVARPAGEEEYNPIFDALVTREGEISGLVAYSIYKQNKRAWLQDFIKATRRPPTEAESRAYIIGESTERRIGTYRHLAAATLAGQGPDAHGAYAASRRSRWLFVIGSLVLVAALCTVWFALHSRA